MFGKRAVIITQCLGAGGKSAAKDCYQKELWPMMFDVQISE